MDRREFLAGAAAAAALLATRRSASLAAERERLNLILIFADDIGIGDIHCYGADHYQTPNLDALAAGGTRFESCFSTPLCGPSRCQTLTGRYPFRTHMTSNSTGNLVKPANEIFLPTVLKAAGYATASIGKWSQLPLQPGDFGFDEYLRFTGSGKYWPTQEQTYVLNGENKPLHDGQYVPDVMHDFLVDFATRHHDLPFYVHYPMAHCHGPIQRTPDTPADAPRERFYADNVAYMDKLVGRL
ncbi:MAG: sulfatase-like hydrolase/transferase, partial [Armatimonadetes bacterium]|nr:sulfatase-like hydrolase/transferase [Armatimonadota bacterium]